MIKILPKQKYELEVKVSVENKKSVFTLTHCGERIEPYFLGYTRIDYENDGVVGIEPMSAHELDLDKQDYVSEVFDTLNTYAEEKMDGTRGTLHIGDIFSRVFSRYISVKSDWYTENTDSLPQLRDLHSVEYAGSILDGEMYVPNRPFKDVSGTLNCLWDEAIYRQSELGLIAMRVFDITHFKGESIKHLPLKERKQYLKEVVRHLNSAYVVEMNYFDDLTSVTLSQELITDILNEYHYKIEGEESLRYPNLTELLVTQLYERDVKTCGTNFNLMVNKRAYYEYIVATGGEGIILKNKNAPYEHKRSKSFLKVKKNFTREVIIIGFGEPTKEYTGKLPDTWTYWENTKTKEVKVFDWDNNQDLDYFALNEKDLKPVTKYYAEKWIGTVKFGVVITEDEIQSLSKKKTYFIQKMKFGNKYVNVIEVGECSGMNETTRHMFSCQYIDQSGEYVHCKNEREVESAEHNDLEHAMWEGRVIEVLANDLFKDTGKLRHPRYFRLREDKDPLACTWSEHLNVKAFSK